jgi:hypothetical protein
MVNNDPEAVRGNGSLAAVIKPSRLHRLVFARVLPTADSVHTIHYRA